MQKVRKIQQWQVLKLLDRLTDIQNSGRLSVLALFNASFSTTSDSQWMEILSIRYDWRTDPHSNRRVQKGREKRFSPYQSPHKTLGVFIDNKEKNGIQKNTDTSSDKTTNQHLTHPKSNIPSFHLWYTLPRSPGRIPIFHRGAPGVTEL